MIETREERRQVAERHRLAALRRAHDQPRHRLAAAVEEPQFGVGAGLSPQERRAERPGAEPANVLRHAGERGERVAHGPRVHARERPAGMDAGLVRRAAGVDAGDDQRGPAQPDVEAERAEVIRAHRGTCHRRRDGRRHDREVRLADALEHVPDDDAGFFVGGGLLGAGAQLGAAARPSRPSTSSRRRSCRAERARRRRMSRAGVAAAAGAALATVGTGCARASEEAPRAIASTHAHRARRRPELILVS